MPVFRICRRIALAALRDLVRGTLPKATETIRYRVPTCEVDEVICSFASQKQYMSLYLDTMLVDRYRGQLI